MREKKESPENNEKDKIIGCHDFGNQNDSLLSMSSIRLGEFNDDGFSKNMLEKEDWVLFCFFFSIWLVLVFLDNFGNM